MKIHLNFSTLNNKINLITKLSSMTEDMVTLTGLQIVLGAH